MPAHTHAHAHASSPLADHENSNGNGNENGNGTILSNGDGIRKGVGLPSDSAALSVSSSVHSASSSSKSHHLLTETQAIISLVKGIVGAGSFALPWAFYNSGLLCGIISVIGMAALCAHTIKLLVHIKRALFGLRRVTYFELAEKVLGKQAAFLAYAAVVACSLGVATAYLDFIVCLTTAIVPSVTTSEVLLVALPIITFLALLRSFRHLAFSAVLGDVAIVSGAMCVLIYGFSVPGLAAVPDLTAHGGLYFKPRTFPAFLGVAAFLFAVHFFVLPIENAMQQPHRFNSAVDKSFAITALLNLVFGALGLLFFGSSVQTIVIDNVTGGAWIVACKLLLCLDMIFSYAIVFRPGTEIIERAVLGEAVYRTTKPKHLRDNSTAQPSQSPRQHQQQHQYHHSDDSHHADSFSIDLHSRSKPPANPLSVDSLKLPNDAVTTSANGTASSSASSSSDHRVHSTNIFFDMFGTLHETKRSCIRIFLILFTGVLSVSLPMFSVVINLVGGISMVSLGFIFPPVMWIVLHNYTPIHAIEKHRDRMFAAARAQEEIQLTAQQTEHTALLRGDSHGEGANIAMRRMIFGTAEDNGGFHVAKRVTGAELAFYCAVILFGLFIMLITVIDNAQQIIDAIHSGTPLQAC